MRRQQGRGGGRQLAVADLPRAAVVPAAPSGGAFREAQLQIARATAHAAHGSGGALGDLQIVERPVCVAGADAWLLADADREERAGDAEHDVSHGRSLCGPHLGRLRATGGEEPLEASSGHLDERRLIQTLSRWQWLRALGKVVRERTSGCLGPLLVLRPSLGAWEHV